MNLKKKVLIAVLPAIIISISMMAGIVIYINYKYSKEQAKEVAINKAARHAEKIERYFDNYINFNENYRDLAGDFENIPVAERRTYYNNISKLFLEKNKNILAIWLNLIK